MTAFLFVTACVAVLAGLVGLVVGSMPWVAWPWKARRAAGGSW
jgi:hypothetical protein